MRRLLFLWLLVATPLSASTAGEAGHAGDTLEGWEAAAPEDPPANWVDTSHAYATNSAQALSEWMDDFFGDPEYVVEQAESQLRLEFSNRYESDRGNDAKIKLRGKLQLPKISRRLNLVFNGEESESELDEEQRADDQVAVQLQVREGRRSRFDATMGYSSGNLRPGIKYRSEGSIDDRHSYRFVERIQYDNGEKFYSISQLDLNRSVRDDSVVRWSSRLIYGEKTEGVEWRTGLSYRQRKLLDSPRPLVTSYYFVVDGATRPQGWTKNYRLGLSWRRQVYRDFLFLTVEPTYNYLRREYGDQRTGVFGLVLRLEVALQKDLSRLK